MSLHLPIPHRSKKTEVAVDVSEHHNEWDETRGLPLVFEI